MYIDIYICRYVEIGNIYRNICIEIYRGLEYIKIVVFLAKFVVRGGSCSKLPVSLWES